VSARLDVSTGRGNPDGTYPTIVGHTGGVADVKVDIAAGTSVSASVANSYYLAWWPEPDTVMRITGTDPSGKVIGALEQPIAQ
jgi:hypothetical protein